MNDQQYRLWKSMIDEIKNYINNENQEFYCLVGGLECTLEASEITDDDLIDQWYDFWGPLEILNAVRGSQVTKADAIAYLLAMKKFLLRRLETASERRKKLDVLSIKNLSFPGFKLEDMEFSPEEKRLSIFMEGGWLEEEGGKVLGNGLLIFNNWEFITINRFDSVTETWSLLENENAHPEYLKDIQEFKFFNTNVCLRGLGEKTGQLLEWKIVNPEIYAEFEPEMGEHS